MPTSFLPPAYDGVAALGFLPAFGVGSLLGAMLLCTLLQLWHGRAAPLAFGTRGTVLAGVASGFVWNGGNVCQLIAMKVFEVPYGVAYPILQASLVVAGLLGIFVFREIRRTAAVLTFFASAALVVAGALLLGVYGPGAAAAAPPHLPPLGPPLSPGLQPLVRTLLVAPLAPPPPPPPFPPPLPWVVPSALATAPAPSAFPLLPPQAPPPMVNGLADFEGLALVLCQIMIVQLVGYLLKVAGVVTSVMEAGIGAYVGLIGFPCVIFKALATLNLSTGGGGGGGGSILYLVLAISIAKLFVFGLAGLLALVNRGNGCSGDTKPGTTLSSASLFAIFATQSDDIALGIPALGKLVPGHASTLYLLSALQVSIADLRVATSCFPLPTIPTIPTIPYHSYHSLPFPTSPLPCLSACQLPYFATSLISCFPYFLLPCFPASLFPHFPTSPLPHFPTSPLPYFATCPPSPTFPYLPPYFPTPPLPYSPTPLLPHLSGPRLQPPRLRRPRPCGRAEGGRRRRRRVRTRGSP